MQLHAQRNMLVEFVVASQLASSHYKCTKKWLAIYYIESVVANNYVTVLSETNHFMKYVKRHYTNNYKY